MVSRIKKATSRGIAKSRPTPCAPVPLPQRLDAVEAFVAANDGCSLATIAAGLGYLRNTARTYTRLLCREGRLHRTTKSGAHGGVAHTYHLGPAPADLATIVATGAHASDSEFTRPVRTTYPLHHKRDLWACAMFPVPAVMLEQRA